MQRSGGEKGYPWFSFAFSNSWRVSLPVTLLIITLSTVIFLWYSNTSDDVSPDSIAGYAYAFAGSTCMILAAIHFSLQRRSHKRAVGKLNGILNWHICFGLTAIILLFMHSFGNFNPRTGTYALYGMIALVISGIIGRVLDRLMPRLIAGEVRKALTTQGEDRIESISQPLYDSTAYTVPDLQPSQVNAKKDSSGNTGSALQRSNSPRTGRAVLQTSWDLAYISLDEGAPELSQEAPPYRYVTEARSQSRPLLSDTQQNEMSQLQNVQYALQREAFYRYVIRYWRIFHMGLALLTIGLTIWHIVYALQLLIPTFFQP